MCRVYRLVARAIYCCTSAIDSVLKYLFGDVYQFFFLRFARQNGIATAAPSFYTCDDYSVNRESCPPTIAVTDR